MFFRDGSLGEGFANLLKDLLFKREHVGQVVASGFTFMLESFSLELAGLLFYSLDMLLYSLFDFELDLEGSSLGRTTLGLIGELHHLISILYFNNQYNLENLTCNNPQGNT